MSDELGGADVGAARSLADKLVSFKQMLNPQERALFAALIFSVQNGSEAEVSGYDARLTALVTDVLSSVYPAPFPVEVDVESMAPGPTLSNTSLTA